jgi:hypothetical protein
MRSDEDHDEEAEEIFGEEAEADEQILDLVGPLF